jgi:uroporphyrinogen-III synthase
VIAPLINFAPSTDQTTLETALADLAAGAFDWVTLTSATTVDVLYAYRAQIPAATRVAAVGETTAAALSAVGYRVDLVPDEDNSAAGMAAQLIALEPDPRHILTLRSEIAKPVLTRRLTEAGHECAASSRTAPWACRSPSASPTTSRPGGSTRSS